MKDQKKLARAKNDEQQRRGIIKRGKVLVKKSRKVVPPPKREMIGRQHEIKYRVTAQEWREARYMAAARGWPTLSAYLRALVAEDAVKFSNQ